MRRLAAQLVDASCSIGANAAEAPGGQSRADFITKNCIALKEGREARYRLRLIAATEPGIAATAGPLIQEASELVAIFHAIVHNSRVATEQRRSRVRRQTGEV